ncbi:MAG: MaoC family dehydratase [Myxococcota bacterium]
MSDSSTRRFEDVELGDDLPDTRPDVSLEKVRRFCHTTGMTFGRFLDDEAARSEGLPGAIVPGIMSQGLLAAMIHAWAPGSNVRKLDTIFRAPIPVGSSPVCRGAVTDLDEEARTVEVDLTIVNEAGETRVVGTAIVAL